MSLFRWSAEPFLLHSGQESNFKIECDALTNDDWDCLARLVAAMVPPFRVAIGVPRGGTPLALALDPFAAQQSLTVLIVDDVWTTGGSMRAMREKVRQRWPGVTVAGAVVFARGRVDPWVQALFQLHQQCKA